jgi:hypothetical protein
MFRCVGILGFAGMVIVWLAYLELSPRLGNIWLRPDAEGVRRFAPGGLKALFVAPWRTWELWSPAFWDVNPWPAICILGVPALLWASADPSPESLPHPHAACKMSL